MVSSTTQDRKSAKREAIIQAAAAVFAERGFAGATVAGIAASADVGKGTVYEYFDSKEDIFLAVFELLMGQLAEDLATQQPGGGAVEQLRVFSEAFVAWINHTSEAYSLTLEFWAAAGTSPMRDRLMAAFRQGYLQYREFIADILHQGQEHGEIRPDVDVEAVATALVGMWDALGLQAWMFTDLDVEGVNRGFLDAMLTGLIPQA